MKERWVGIIAACMGFLILGCMSDEQRKQAAADKIGAVDLRPEMSLGHLKKVLREEHPEISIEGSVKNITFVTLGNRLVHATFLRSVLDTSPPDDLAVPISVRVYKPFKGTMCGVPLDATLDSALETVRKSYPQAQFEKYPFGEDRRIVLNAFLESTYYLELRTDGLEVKSNRYTLAPY